ncbi:MAG: ATP-binding protein [Acidimicrobiales bacterium]
MTDPEEPFERDADAAGWLLSRLNVLEAQVADAVERRRKAAAEAGQPGNGGQGLFVSEADVARLLASHPPSPDADAPTRLLETMAEVDEDCPEADRCGRVGRTFDLAPLDLAILLVALAPDVDRRFEELYAYLNDDVARKRPTIGLCLELCGISVASHRARTRLRSDAPLLRHRLLRVEDNDLPFPSRVLRVPDRVLDHLVGSDLPDEVVAPLILPPLAVASSHAELVEAALTQGVGLFYLRGARGPADHAEAAGALAELGLRFLAVDLAKVDPHADPVETAAAIAREAGLLESGLVVGSIDDLVARDPRVVVALSGAPGPVVLLGSRAWEPGWTAMVPVILDVAPPEPTHAAEVWRAALDGDGEPSGDLTAATSAFRLGPHQALRAAWAAQAYAAAHGGSVDAEAVRAGARAQNGGGLEALARRVRPRATPDDLVLADPALAQVMEISRRARLRQRVVGEWQMLGLGSRGNGITVLFAGPSGTGKTLAAEVIAGSLGLELYVVDLSSVVDKYIGETEKNLERIFSGAQGLNGVLFFDEADALFGKRSAVSDGHDRYANIEVAYLLQRMEQFDGISLLATNLSANLDDAFARRIDLRVVFPLPEAAERRRLWERHLPPTLPVADDLDVAFLADAFRLAGGDIRNITLAAAYDAASQNEPVGMAHLVRATAREYRKLGRLCTEEDFGPYLHLAAV